jgi:hypothetical protein
LHLLGVPVPNDMDGQVLEDILDTDVVTPVTTQSELHTIAVESSQDSAYTEEDTVVIAERLRALGYIE